MLTLASADRGVAQPGQSIGLQNRGPRVRILPPLPCFLAALVFRIATFGRLRVAVQLPRQRSCTAKRRPKTFADEGFAGAVSLTADRLFAVPDSGICRRFWPGPTSRAAPRLSRPLLIQLTWLHGHRRAAMDVQPTHRPQNGLGQAPVADRRRAISLIAACAGLDGSTAYGAFQNRGTLCHELFLTASSTSFCKSRPTSLPSDVVTGELSSL